MMVRRAIGGRVRASDEPSALEALLGADRMQALCLDIELVRRRLVQELETGGRLSSTDDDESFDETSNAALFGVSVSESAG
jgi:hypothetical protein